MHNQQQLTKNDCRQRAPAVTITARDCIKTRPFIYHSESEHFNPVHHLEERANIVLVDWERRIVRRHAPDEVRVVIVVVATLYHAVVIGNHHIDVAVHDTLATVHSLHAHNVAIIDFGFH